MNYNNNIDLTNVYSQLYTLLKKGFMKVVKLKNMKHIISEVK
jgi:hypothetical protein